MNTATKSRNAQRTFTPGPAPITTMRFQAPGASRRRARGDPSMLLTNVRCVPSVGREPLERRAGGVLVAALERRVEVVERAAAFACTCSGVSVPRRSPGAGRCMPGIFT